MNTGPDNSGKSPRVNDLQITIGVAGRARDFSTYGPYNARVLRNYVDANPKYSAYYTQRNSDSYACFAVAKHVEKQINSYPYKPSPGALKPQGPPKDLKTGFEPEAAGGAPLDPGLADGDVQDDSPDITYPGCSDERSQDAVVDTENWTLNSSAPIATLAPTSPDLVLTCTESGLPFPQLAVAGFIDQFCGDKSQWDIVLAPIISRGGDRTKDGDPKACNASRLYQPDASMDLVGLAVVFAHDICSGTIPFTVGASHDEKFNHCKTRFQTILDGCQTDTITAKLGGYLKDGCLEYRIQRAKVGEDPFYPWTLKDEMIACNDTDVSAIGGNDSPLKNTCTCWCDQDVNHTDIFKMPRGGCTNLAGIDQWNSNSLVIN